MEQEIPIKLSATNIIGGNHPLVIIGPNGSGKSKYGSQLADLNKADLIGAIRNIQLGQNISMRNYAQAMGELDQYLNRRRSKYWEISSEIDQLFSKLLAEDSDLAIKFRNDYLTDKNATPQITKIMILADLWTDLFPSRKIDFTSYSPKVLTNYGGSAKEYAAQSMSDGERVAVYLAGRVIDSNKNIIIVDEPEVHFHSQLAIRFWDKLEKLRSDCRFVYITHDLTFALSRNSGQYIVIQPNKDPEVVPLDSQLPSSVKQSILNAASFSIFARRIIFCESDDTKNNNDNTFYLSWFNDNDTAIIPVNSCSDVIQCTKAFSNEKIVSGVSSFGIIDRDYWSDDYLSSLPDEVHCLPVHEIENLYCLRGVFEALGNYLSVPSEQIQIKYAEFLERAKAIFKGGILCKQISERFKKRYELQFYILLNNLKGSDDLDALKAQYLEALKIKNWHLDPELVFDEERKRVQASIASEEEFFKIMPGKSFFSMAADALGISVTRYKELIHSSLIAEQGSNLYTTGQSIQNTLEPYLLPRKL